MQNPSGIHLTHPGHDQAPLSQVPLVCNDQSFFPLPDSSHFTANTEVGQTNCLWREFWATCTVADVQFSKTRWGDPTPVPSLTSDPSFWLRQLCCATQALSYIFAADASSLLLLLFLWEAAAISECSNDLQCIGHSFITTAFKIHHSSPCPSSTSNLN